MNIECLVIGFAVGFAAAAFMATLIVKLLTPKDNE